MTRLIVSPIEVPADAIVCVDLGRRVYLGMSRDESYLHIVRPRGYEQTDEDGNVTGRATDLVCSCKGFTFHGHCYQATNVERIETELDGPATEAEIAWMGRPIAPATELERAAARG